MTHLDLMNYTRVDYDNAFRKRKNTLHDLVEALEEAEWKVTGDIKVLVGAYTGDINTTLMVEQLFGDLRKAERLLQVRWSASPAQLQCVQLRAMDHRWRDSFDVGGLF